MQERSFWWRPLFRYLSSCCYPYGTSPLSHTRVRFELDAATRGTCADHSHYFLLRRLPLPLFSLPALCIPLSHLLPPASEPHTTRGKQQRRAIAPNNSLPPACLRLGSLSTPSHLTFPGSIFVLTIPIISQSSAFRTSRHCYWSIFHCSLSRSANTASPRFLPSIFPHL